MIGTAKRGFRGAFLLRRHNRAAVPADVEERLNPAAPVAGDEDRHAGLEVREKITR
jgi:hypothetical protein